MIQIVVARYNEDVEWTRQFPNVIIYNKGEPLEGFDNVIEGVPNVGREGHTYYKYICDHYDNLSDHIIFLQGRSNDHSPNIIENLHKIINEPNLSCGFGWLSESIHYSSIYTCFDRVFGIQPYGLMCEFGCGAQFIVHSSLILNKPKRFYENIVNILGYHIDPKEGYDIELFHKYIFTFNYQGIHNNL